MQPTSDRRALAVLIFGACTIGFGPVLVRLAGGPPVRPARAGRGGGGPEPAPGRHSLGPDRLRVWRLHAGGAPGAPDDHRPGADVLVQPGRLAPAADLRPRAW